MAKLLILGAGYLGSALAQRALGEAHEVTLADNWYATERSQTRPLEELGARVRDADIRLSGDLERLLDEGADVVFLTAAQASRPRSERDPDYTEETNLGGARRVAQAVAAARGATALVYLSSLHVYGSQLRGAVAPGHPYGRQGDLAHLSKVYAELCLEMYARRAGFDLTLLRLGIVYGPSIVEHAAAESETVVNRFRRLALSGEPLHLEDGGRATIGVVDLRDACRIMLDSLGRRGVFADNVAAETLTVADVAALAEGREPTGEAAWRCVSSFDYEHRLADHMRRP